MAFFNRFPYSNFHELNLDWILQKINELIGTDIVKTVNNKSADNTGNIEIEATDIPNSVLTVNNISPDSSGNIDAGTVKTVNNNSPDSDGNVDVGTVKSVNLFTPDSSGNVALTASRIPGSVQKVNNTSPDSSGNVDVGTVKSVNGTSPDTSGNVNLPTVAGVTSVNGVGADGSGNVQLDATDVGAVATINSISPDSDGDVSLDASDVNAIPDGDVKYKVYNSVSDISVTIGTATITGVWNRLVTLNEACILICDSSEFDPTEIPTGVTGKVYFVYDNSNGFIELYSNDGYIVYSKVFSSGTPTDWMQVTSDYFGAHTLTCYGFAETTGTIGILIPWNNPIDRTPTITNMSAVIGSGIGSADSVVVNTGRLHKNNLAFTVSKTGLTQWRAYVVNIEFTIS